MSDAKRLLSEATPLPWGPVRYALGISLAATEEDYALIVFAVNRLPDYEAAVEALEGLHKWGGAIFDADTASHNEGPTDLEWASFEEALQEAAEALAALARLRAEVPA